MESRIQVIFNQELFYRIISVFIFVPLVVVPIFLSNYLLVITYLFFCSIITYELLEIQKKNDNKILLSIFILISIFVFFTFILIILTNSYYKYFILELIVTIWLFDTFSYLGGKTIGGKKLIPRISEGKTVSGLVTGILLTIITIYPIKLYLQIFDYLSLIVPIFVIIIAFSGDLIASILKRKSNVKDSGNIMPGHGGLFDRFDSFIAVFFVFELFYIFL